MLDECQRLDIQVRAPHINHSKWDSFATSESEVQLGMSIIKGLGVEVARRIVEERASGGEYSGLFEFCHRIGGAHIGGQALSGLIHAGSLDGLIPNRLSAYSIARNCFAGIDNAQSPIRGRTERSVCGGGYI